MQIEGDAVIKPDALIINRSLTNQAKTECDDFSTLLPEEEARPFRHLLRNGAKIIFR